MCFAVIVIVLAGLASRFQRHFCWSKGLEQREICGKEGKGQDLSDPLEMRAIRKKSLHQMVCCIAMDETEGLDLEERKER